MNSTDLAHFTKLIPKIKEYDERLEKQNLWWSVVAMVGKVNNQNMEGQLLESITDTQHQFEQLRSELIESLVKQYVSKVSVELNLKAHAFIDTLNRNLFERTADVGFLSTDDTLVSFLKTGDFSEPVVNNIRDRLQEYVNKYTVYDDIVILDAHKNVVARLDSSITVDYSASDAVNEALKSNDYIETDLPLDILPKATIPLFYLQSIRNSRGDVLGVLCLSFKLEDELKLIHTNLIEESSYFKLALVNENNEVMYPLNSDLPKVLPNLDDTELNQIKLHNEPHFVFAAKAHGYQGFQGLPWRGVLLSPMTPAFQHPVEALDIEIDTESRLFPHDLNEINLEVNTALLIVVLNGKIISIKNKVKAFLPILDSFQEIGTEIRQIFADSIGHIHQITQHAFSKEVTFLSKLAMDIMDRNLYERANDCRWWALTPLFKRILSNPEIHVSMEERQQLTDTLNYINKLYTVYTHLFIYNKEGHIVAMSNDPPSNMMNTNIINLPEVKHALTLHNSQAYSVSPFVKTEFYDNKPTYIYHAPISNTENSQRNEGGVGIVFNSEVEFKAILEDFLPHDINEKTIPDSFGMFIDNHNVIISVTDNKHGFKVGDEIELPVHIFSDQCDDNSNFHMELDKQDFVVGYQTSASYREYKNNDGYENLIATLIFAAT